MAGRRATKHEWTPTKGMAGEGNEALSALYFIQPLRGGRGERGCSWIGLGRPARGLISLDLPYGPVALVGLRTTDRSLTTSSHSALTMMMIGGDASLVRGTTSLEPLVFVWMCMNMCVCICTLCVNSANMCARGICIV